MQQKSQRKGELDNEKPAPLAASIAMGYIYGSQSGKLVKIYITLTGVYQVPTKNVDVYFTERSLDLFAMEHMAYKSNDHKAKNN
uniref:Uncharacterized protein n=1 Tax=Prolemur simus TaxID=1328070 RepID=A0A8C8ZUL4_PROSS